MKQERSAEKGNNPTERAASSFAKVTESKESHASTSRTRASLIASASRGDAIAWSKLNDIYYPLLLNWGKRLGLQHADAEDLANEVLIFMYQTIGEFQYNPDKTFRGYLRTSLGFKVKQFWRKHKRIVTGESVLLNGLCTEDSQSQLIDLLLGEVEQLRDEVLLPAAKQRCSENRWRAYELLVFEKLSGEQAAEQLKIERGSVYVFAGRFRKALAEVAKERNLMG